MDLAWLSGGLAPTLLIAAPALITVAGLQHRRATAASRHPDKRPEPPYDARRTGASSDQDRIAGQDSVLADISHELRTPLVALLGYAELLGETRLGPHQREYADAIAAAGANLLDIVEDLTRLSHTESHPMTCREQTVAVHECVDGVAAMMALSAYRKGLDFFRVIDADVPVSVHGDPLLLRQALINLVANAIKFTRNGSVRLHVGLAGTDAAGDGLEFAVADTGIGIAAENQHDLFRPFARTRPTTVTQGDGLGLVITRRLCEAMHGEIAVQSEPGRGSRFTVRIPFETGAGPAVAAAAVPELTGRRVAVSCDDEAFAKWLSDCLSRHGAQPVRAALEPGSPAASLQNCDVAIVFVGQDLLSAPDRLASVGAALDKRGSMLCLVSTVSEARLQQIETLFGGTAMTAHAPAASICARVAALAAATPARPTTASDEPSGNSDLRGLRLLVADDDVFSRDYLRVLLTRHGADVDVCKDGNEAFEQVRRHDFAAVLMDVRMPGCDGTTAARRLRAAGYSLPVIGLTAAAAECPDARAAGMTECLVKPLRSDELLKTITTICGIDTGVSFAGRDFIDAEILASLDKELPQYAQRMTSALERNDRAALLEVAHRLNGIGSLFGFDALRDRASRLEAVLRAGQPGIEPHAGDLLSEVNAIHRQVGDARHQDQS